MQIFGKNKPPIFPKSAIDWFKARLNELVGLLLIFLSVFLAISILYYKPFDASFNTFNVNEISNPLGYLGSFTADILKQTFGFFSWLFPLTIFIIANRIISHKKNIISAKKILAFVSSIIFLDISLQAIFIDEVISSAPLNYNTVGGFVGLIAVRNLYHFMMTKRIVFWFVPLMMLFFYLGITLWKFSIGLRYKQIAKFIKLFGAFIVKVFRKFLHKKVDKNKDIEEMVKPPAEMGKDVPEEKRSLFNDANSGSYKKPHTNLLSNTKEENFNLMNKESLNILGNSLLNVLGEFGVHGEILAMQLGPVVTMYEFRPAAGIKTSRVISLSDDIARSMSALSARIATIPGKNAIGIELPNEKRNSVYLKTLLQERTYWQSNLALPLILGKDISGLPVIADLAKMPHLLVAGTTGSGKSVSINTMILSLLFKFSPAQCKFIMIDPKMLELSVYDDIPHLLTPVVTEPKKAIYALKWAVREMETRYKAMSRLGVRNIDGFNQKVREGRKKGDIFIRKVQIGFDNETGKPLFEDQQLDYKEIPFIVVVVDEMADLMLVAGKEIELAVQRLAQMARAAGIHLIMATQRPSVDVITGTIKANFPTRISFQVTSKIDSRTILGEQGAEQLLGCGDMLYMSGGGRIQRVHGPFVSDDDVEKVSDYLRTQGSPDYVEGITDEEEEMLLSDMGDDSEQADLYMQAVDIIRGESRVSISFLQRQLGIGYNKSAKLVERMEKEGLVSKPDRTGKRELL